LVLWFFGSLISFTRKEPRTKSQNKKAPGKANKTKNREKFKNRPSYEAIFNFYFLIYLELGSSVL
jgi:hypothetical protein